MKIQKQVSLILGIGIWFSLTPYTLHLTPALASVQQELYVTATVESFGEYTFSEGVIFQISQTGQQEVGQIVVEGLYNGPYPWILRVYTDNLNFSGVGGAIRQPSPAGLVSEDGRFVIPLSIHSPSFGLNISRRIPDLSEPGYLPYLPDPDPGEVPYSDCVIMGIDPRNATWVAGADKILYTADDNPLGDNTLPSPFTLSLEADISESAVRGPYETTLYFEIIPAP